MGLVLGTPNEETRRGAADIQDLMLHRKQVFYRGYRDPTSHAL